MRNITKYFIVTLCCISFTLLSHAKGISGKVISTDGTPLSGVVITQKDGDHATISNNEGEFNFETENLPLNLLFELSGFKSSNVAFKKQSDDELVVMEGDTTEYAYVAYGKKPAQAVSASIYSISGEDIISNRSSNLLIALQGRLPGLTLLQNSGEPGRESFSARIRGFDTPNSNGVMFIVDGVERNPDGIDPYEVENVTILKDAAATAMYGMRGSGGVIMITTKSGYDGKSKINISVDQAFQSPTRLPKLVSAGDYATMYNQRQANDTLFADAQDIAAGGSGLDHSNTTFYTPYEIERYRNADMTEFYPVRDMVGDFTKDFSQLTRVNVNFQGGSEMMKFFTSVGYMHQGGLFENEPFDAYSYDAESKSSRFNFRTNMDVSINENLEAWVKIGGYMEKANAPHVGNGQGWDFVLAKLYETPNNAHNDLTPDGEVLVKRDKLNFRNTESVYGYLNRTGSTMATITRLGNTFGAKQKLNGITEGLSASAQLAFDIWSSNTQIRRRDYEAWEVANFLDVDGLDSLGYAKVPGSNNTILSDGQASFFSYMYNMRVSLDYDRTFAGKHRVTAQVLGERQMEQRQILVATNYLGLAGRVNYGFDNKYFLDFNAAYQGSEQFAKDNRFGFFPSLSAAWILSNESFLMGSEALSFLKFKASVGQVGNDVFAYGSTNRYLYLTTWNNNATEDQLGNPNITWETYTKYNVGFEAELYNSLYMGADYFYHDNRDIMIMNVDIIPGGMMGLGGTSMPPANLGELINQGFEIVAGYHKSMGNDFGVAIDGNLSFSTNEQQYMAEMPYDDSYAYEYRRQGYPVNYFWGYQTAGLFNTQDEIDAWDDQSALGGVPIPGDIKYVDMTGDGIVDEKDRAPLGVNSNPKMVYGIRAQVNYKWFDLNVFVSGVTNRNVYLSGFGRWSNRDNFTEYMKEAWTAGNEDAVYPRLGNNTTNYIVSDYWIVNGSFHRVKNLELGFTIPESITNRINASSIRLYVNGLNPFVFDSLPNDDFDPEATAGGNINYPIIKSYNFGVSMKF